jgi:surfactin synthase thioesterase subunit
MQTSAMHDGMIWLAGRPPSQVAGFRVFCFPYAGLGASVFRPWIGALGNHVDFCPVQLPGRETREDEPPFRRMESLADATAAALASHVDAPFALFGHSLGAVLAFELARRFRGHRFFQHLFVSARRAPHLADGAVPISHLPDSRFIDEVQKRYRGIPQAVLECPELLDRLLPRLRADFELLETYTFRSADPVEVPVSVFGGSRDETVSEGDLQAWRTHTLSRIRVRTVDGPHLFLQERRRELIDAVAEDLALQSHTSSRAAV